jgi:hypothetical protein
MAAETITFGYTEGETCWRNGCKGLIAYHEREGCSCHINPPCGSCTAPRGYCPECDWQERDDHGTFNDFSVKYVDRKQGYFGGFESYKPRPLDPRKLDWRSKGHTSSSMIKEGVYPEGMAREEVEKAVRGTFGGRFNHFGNGRFEYVAYTD